MLITLLTAAWAAPVAFRVDAEVATVDDRNGGLRGAIVANDPLVLTYTYDTATADTSPIPTVGDYWHSSPPWGVRVDVGPFSFGSDPSATNLLLELVNDHGSPASDNYLLRSYNNVTSRGSVGIPVDHISWQLDDDSLAALSSTSLTTLPPVLPLWDSIFGITVEGSDPLNPFGGSWFLRAHALTIRQVPAISATPASPGRVSFAVTGVRAGGNFAVLTANNLGHTQVPVGPCAGTDTWLDRPTLRTTLRADAAGAWSATLVVPAALSGQWLTVVDMATCDVAMSAIVP